MTRKKHALVTGASSGIGEAFAARLAAAGWRLTVVARRREGLEELAARLAADHGADVHLVEADLASGDGLDAVTRIASQEPFDLLVNNAALAHYMPFVELEPAAARELVDSQRARARRAQSRGAPRDGRTRGRSGRERRLAARVQRRLGEPAAPERAVYASSKSFLLTFTQILAAELAGTGVRVQVLCPGVVRTEFHSRQGMDMTGRQRMEPDDVVAASLADLEDGVVVSIPGLDDPSVLVAALAAQAPLAGSTTATSLPERYAHKLTG